MAIELDNTFAVPVPQRQGARWADTASPTIQADPQAGRAVEIIRGVLVSAMRQDLVREYRQYIRPVADADEPQLPLGGMKTAAGAARDPRR